MLKESDASITGLELERLAKEAILALIAKIPGAKADIIQESNRREWDFKIDLAVERRHQTLVCEVRSRAWPNEIHGVGHRLSRAVNKSSVNHCTPVFIAPYLSQQAIEACGELGLSWADLAGNCELKIPGAYVKVTGLLNPLKHSRGSATLYSPKSSAVVHALLLAPTRSWTTEELGKVAGVSVGQVASVKRLLERNHWIRSGYGETTLIEPRKLLDDWAIHYSPKRAAIRFFTLDSPAQFEERVGLALSDYAFTEFSAAQRYAPYTRHQRTALYVPYWTGEQSTLLGLKHGDGAANVTIYATGEPLSFVEQLHTSRCISPIIAYLDLKLLAGRGQDAAEHLLESVIEPRWK